MGALAGTRRQVRKRDTATGDLFAEPQPARSAGTTEDQRR
jgi:hypothetical protein